LVEDLLSAGRSLHGGPLVYDLKGLKCPLPALKTRKRLAAIAPGELLWIETSDPLASIDIPALCHDDGHRLVDTIAIPGGHRFLIERGRLPQIEP
jgi:tRNA 2-thiouridine synthesizing protein A